MEIIITQSSEKFHERHDYRNFLKISIVGGETLEFLDGEPEDACLCRDFNCCHGILSVMDAAYTAGANGEEFNVITREIDSLDEI